MNAIDLDVKCPVTGLVVDLQAEILAAPFVVEVSCPICEKAHHWNPARKRLVAPKLPSKIASSETLDPWRALR